MKGNSTPGNGSGDGSSIDDLIRNRERKSAGIREDENRKSLERQRTLERDSAKQSNAELTTIYKNTVRTASDTASKLLDINSQMIENVNQKLTRLRRRIWYPWLPFLLGVALVPAVQATALNWDWQLIRPHLENLVLSRTGWTIQPGPDGHRWLLIPKGTELLSRDRTAEWAREPLTTTAYFLIPEN